jgi:hypothetical protein
MTQLTHSPFFYLQQLLNSRSEQWRFFGPQAAQTELFLLNIGTHHTNTSWIQIQSDFIALGDRSTHARQDHHAHARPGDRSSFFLIVSRFVLPRDLRAILTLNAARTTSCLHRCSIEDLTTNRLKQLDLNTATPAFRLLELILLSRFSVMFISNFLHLVESCGSVHLWDEVRCTCKTC